MKARIVLRVVGVSAILFALVLALSGCSARGSNQATVPSQVRKAIVKDYPGMAFVPARLPKGYHYANWTHSRARHSAYELIFIHGSITHQVDLQVVRRSCPAPPKWRAKGTLHVNGHALKWLQTDNGAIVWRCMTNQGRSFVIFGLAGPLHKLAELVGYALPAH